MKFSKITLTTANLLQIVEEMDNATNANDINSIKDKYGRDVLAYL